MLVLSESDVESLVDMNAALCAVRMAFRALQDGKARDLAKQRVASHGTTLHAIGAVFGDGLPGAPWSGAKIYVSGAGLTHWVLLFGTEGLEALVSGGTLGRLRTGAASGVSAELLAAPDAASLGLLGAGRQAWTQVQAVASVRPLDRVTVWSRTRARAAELAERITRELGIAATATDRPAKAVRGHDVVVAISKASEPILSGREVADRAHVVLAGSSHAHRREADAELFRRARSVYVDDLTVAREHSGDLLAAAAEGALDWARVAPIGAAEQHAASGITVFKSNGIGSLDVALAALAVERARGQRVGIEVSQGIRTGKN